MCLWHNPFRLTLDTPRTNPLFITGSIFVGGPIKKGRDFISNMWCNYWVAYMFKFAELISRNCVLTKKQGISMYFTGTNEPLESFRSPSTCIFFRKLYRSKQGRQPSRPDHPWSLCNRTYCWSELVSHWAAKMPGGADGMRWNLLFRFQINGKFPLRMNSVEHFLGKKNRSFKLHFPSFLMEKTLPNLFTFFAHFNCISLPEATASRLLSRMGAQVGCSNRGKPAKLVYPTWIVNICTSLVEVTIDYNYLGHICIYIYIYTYIYIYVYIYIYNYRGMRRCNIRVYIYIHTQIDT